jgi:hypothetical protein
MANPEADMGGYEPRLIPIEDYEVHDLDLYLKQMREGYAPVADPLPSVGADNRYETDQPTGSTQLDFDILEQGISPDA